ncbi:MAG: DUF1266 domain-containing protein [Coriobacteriia bacterium]|nr:DUF1266 domain-containing protein [Coriobacteriia bacterium]
MPAARLMQSTFSSWKDLGDNYIIGRSFWTMDEAGNNAMRQAERER